MENKLTGFIGLGQMGGGMAMNLLASETPLLVFDIDQTVVDTFVNNGAQQAKNLSELSEKCEQVFICLPGETEVEKILSGETGLLATANSNLQIVDTSTLIYTTSQKFAELSAQHGANYSDCPVSGLPKRAADGTLTMMFGGSVESFELARPYLDIMGEQVLHCGDVGAGQMMKAINNVMYNINIAGFCEILPLALKAGLDPLQLETVITSGSSRSFASEHFVPRVLNRQFDSDFPMQAAFKDIANVQQIKSQTSALTPLLDAMTQTYEAALEAGFGAQPKSAMVKVYEKQLDVELNRDKNDS